MTDITCVVIPEPEENSRVVIAAQGRFPIMTGGGSDSYFCGNCNFILARDVNMENIRRQFHTEGGLGIVARCPECQSFNETGADLG